MFEVEIFFQFFFRSWDFFRNVIFKNIFFSDGFFRLFFFRSEFFGGVVSKQKLVLFRFMGFSGRFRHSFTPFGANFGSGTNFSVIYRSTFLLKYKTYTATRNTSRALNHKIPQPVPIIPQPVNYISRQYPKIISQKHLNLKIISQKYLNPKIISQKHLNPKIISLAASKSQNYLSRRC